MDLFLYFTGMFYLILAGVMIALRVQYGPATGVLKPLVYLILTLCAGLGAWLIYLSFTMEGVPS